MVSAKESERRPDGKSGMETVTVSIPSRLELLCLLDKLSDSIAQQMDFDDEQRSAISMSVIEAGTNAIQHGHKVDKGKRVDIRFELHPDRLAVVVSDAGTGFVVEEKEHDITSPEHLFDERGRGIFIIRMCMDEVQFNVSDAGTSVRMVKHRPARNGSAPQQK